MSTILSNLKVDAKPFFPSRTSNPKEAAMKTVLSMGIPGKRSETSRQNPCRMVHGRYFRKYPHTVGEYMSRESTNRTSPFEYPLL